jgi:hypothetical protein
MTLRDDFFNNFSKIASMPDVISIYNEHKGVESKKEKNGIIYYTMKDHFILTFNPAHIQFAKVNNGK